MKIGTPRNAVSTPSLSGVAVGITRTAMSDALSNMAPASADGSSTADGLRSVNRRTRCGTTSPTNPIAPDTATAPPTPIAIPASKTRRTRPRSVPSDRAPSSPSDSASSARPG